MNYEDIQKAIEAAANQSPDMSQAAAGGGGYTPPNKGKCVAILVGYVETGRHLKEYQGNKSWPRRAQFIFELQGGVNPVETNDQGEKVVKRITVHTTMPEPGKQPSEKSGYYKLFSAMNYDGQAKHPAQCVGKHFLVDVQHEEWEKNGQKNISATLGSAQTRFFIERPVVLKGDVLAGDQQEVPIPCPARVSEVRLFLWDFPSKPMWDALYIDGEYPEQKDEKTGKVTRAARSKNVFQLKIKEAKDWAESPMAELLAAGGDVDLPEELAGDPAAAGGAADEDPLAGMV